MSIQVGLILLFVSTNVRYNDGERLDRLQQRNKQKMIDIHNELNGNNVTWDNELINVCIFIVI